MKQYVALAFASVMIWSSPARAELQDCYYVADDPTGVEIAEAGAEFAFPWAIGRQPTLEMRAVNEIFQRTIADYTRSFGSAWLVDRTVNGRRYVRPNGITVQLRVDHCAVGLDLVRRYLAELEVVAPSPEVRSALARFRESAREVPEREYDWASPPIPVSVMPPPKES